MQIGAFDPDDPVIEKDIAAALGDPARDLIPHLTRPEFRIQEALD
jgi:hypothetical protein